MLCIVMAYCCRAVEHCFRHAAWCWVWWTDKVLGRHLLQLCAKLPSFTSALQISLNRWFSSKSSKKLVNSCWCERLMLTLVKALLVVDETSVGRIYRSDVYRFHYYCLYLAFEYQILKKKSNWWRKTVNP